MKKTAFILTAMVLASAPAAFAQQDVNATVPPAPAPVTTTTTTTTESSTDPWQVSVQGGGLWSDKDKSRLHDGEELFGRLTYDVTPNVAFGAESGGLRFKDEIGGIKYGHLDGVPVLGDLVLKMPIAGTGNRLVPYVFGSAGVIFWSYDKTTITDSTGVDARTRSHFAAKPGGGLEYYITPHVALFIEGSYLFSPKFQLKNAPATPPDGKVNVDSIYGGGGLKIAF